MFLAMVKKEIRQFTRAKGNMFMLFIFPILLITTLSVGLKSMMVSSGSKVFGDHGKKDIVYYKVDGDNNQYLEGFSMFKDAVEKEVAIEFKETSSINDAKKIVDKKNALVLVTLKQNGYEIYTSKKGEGLNSKIFRGIFESLIKETAVYSTIGKLNPQAMSHLVQAKFDKYVESDKKAHSKEVTSSEYYTFAELALIILYISIYVGESVCKENQLTTINRIRLSKANDSVLIASKLTLGILIGIVQILFVFAYSSLCLKVDWGQNYLKFIALFITFVIFASVLGIIVGLTCKKDSQVSSTLSAAIVMMSIVGGSYTPLAMIVNVPVLNKLAYLSPIYWINTATSSMVCGYETNAYYIALIIPIVLSLIGVITYLLIMRKKGGLQGA